MKDKNDDLNKLLANLTGEEYCYLTTTGRITGKPHEIEIWFGVKDNSLYLLSGGRGKSDWVKNLIKDPAATVRIAKHIFRGTSRIVTDTEEGTMARYMLAEKYQEWEEGRTLSQWARTSLPVAIDVSE